jgi:hypothetical protein
VTVNRLNREERAVLRIRRLRSRPCWEAHDAVRMLLALAERTERVVKENTEWAWQPGVEITTDSQMAASFAAGILMLDDLGFFDEVHLIDFAQGKKVDDH